MIIQEKRMKISQTFRTGHIPRPRSPSQLSEA